MTSLLAKLAAEITLGEIARETSRLSQLRFDPRQSIVDNLDDNLTAAAGRVDRRKTDIAAADSLRRTHMEMLARQAVQARPFNL